VTLQRKGYIARNTSLKPSGPIKRKKAKRKPPPTKTQLRRKCDILHGRIIRAQGYCSRCGRTQNLQRAHIFSRSYRAIEFDDRNCLCLDSACHVYFTHHPVEWEIWVQERIGLETYYELRAKAMTHVVPDYRELLAELTARCATL